MLRDLQWRLPMPVQRAFFRTAGSKLNPYNEWNQAHRAIFVHVPKTGGTSILKATDAGWQPHVPISRYAAVDPKRCQEYFKFTFVRNPWDRLLSGYAFLRFDRNLPLIERQWAAEHLDRHTDFEAFVLALEDRAYRSMILNYVTFRPQLDWLRLPGRAELNVDFVGHFEKFGEDFAKIARRLEIPDELPKTRQSRRGPYREAYSSRMRKIVADSFAEDIGFFGYSF